MQPRQRYITVNPVSGPDHDEEQVHILNGARNWSPSSGEDVVDEEDQGVLQINITR
jgi:hypothetical protein